MTRDKKSFLFPQFMAKLNSTYFKAVNKQLNQGHLRKTQITDNNIAKNLPNKNKNTRNNINNQKNNDKKYDFLVTDPSDPSFNFSNQQNQQKRFLEQSFSPFDDNQLFSARSNVLEDLSSNIKAIESCEKGQKGLTEKLVEKELKARFEKQTQRFNTMPGFQNDDYKQSLVTENKQELTIQQCLVCFVNDPNAVNMNCGHGGICYDCAIEIMQKTGECYLCRQKIEQILELNLQSSKNQNELEVLQSARLVTCNRTDD